MCVNLILSVFNFFILKKSSSLEIIIIIIIIFNFLLKTRLISLGVVSGVFN